MNIISKIKLSEIIYTLKDLRLPSISGGDSGKILGVNNDGEYELTTKSGGSEIDILDHTLICVNGVDIANHTLLVA